MSCLVVVRRGWIGKIDTIPKRWWDFFYLNVLCWILEDNLIVEFRDDWLASLQRAWISGRAGACLFKESYLIDFDKYNRGINLLRYLEKFEHMVDGDGSLHRISQVDLDLDLKLTPPSLSDLKLIYMKTENFVTKTKWSCLIIDLVWRFGHGAIVVCITVVQLEIHLEYEYKSWEYQNIW